MAQDRVDAVERALSMLEAFSTERRALSLAELAEETGLYKSTILRLAASLDRFGYLRRGQDGRFRLGPAVWRLGALYRGAFNEGSAVRPVLRRLVEATGETASFYVIDAEERLCLYRENSPDAMRHHLDEGARLPLRAGAAGWVLCAIVRRDAEALVRLGPGESCVSVGERNPHVGSVAVAVRGPDGTPHGALAVSGPLGRFDTAARAAALDTLLPLARSLGAQL